MPNPIRYLLGRLRGVVGDRRRAPRYEARLFFSVSVLGGEEGSDGVRPPRTLVGRTRNLSESGLALIVPSLSLGAASLDAKDSTLRVMLDLPSGKKIEIHVTPVRSQRLGEKDEGSGYFIGVLITHMGDEERALYNGILRGLRSRH